jgi:hypothetical protein
VVAIARRVDRLDALVRELRARGAEGLGLAGDVSAEGSIEAAVREAIDRLGRLDVVIANAGISIAATFEKLTLDDFGSVVREVGGRFGGVAGPSGGCGGGGEAVGPEGGPAVGPAGGPGGEGEGAGGAKETEGAGRLGRCQQTHNWRLLPPLPFAFPFRGPSSPA